MTTLNRAHQGWRILAAAAVGGILLSGCSSQDETAPAPTTQAAEAVAPKVEVQPPSAAPGTQATGPGTQAPPSIAPPPEAKIVNDASLQETAAKYLNERENQASHFRSKPGDWLTEARKLMTEGGYNKLTANMGSLDNVTGGYAWNVSHEQGLAVKVDVGQCVELAQGSAGTDNDKTVTCPVRDLVVDKEGKNVPTTKIPPTWPYVGKQQDALLSMKREGGGWKVEADMTGMAN